MGGMLVWRKVLQPRHLAAPPPLGQCVNIVRQGAPLMACIGAVVVAIFTATNLATGLCSAQIALKSCSLLFLQSTGSILSICGVWIGLQLSCSMGYAFMLCFPAG